MSFSFSDGVTGTDAARYILYYTLRHGIFQPPFMNIYIIINKDTAARCSGGIIYCISQDGIYAVWLFVFFALSALFPNIAKIRQSAAAFASIIGMASSSTVCHAVMILPEKSG